MFRRLRSDRAGTVRATARARPTGWGDAIIIIPYQMYMQYGNKAVLTENYETMCNWMEYLVSTSENYIRDESWTGDWLPVGRAEIADCLDGYGVLRVQRKPACRNLRFFGQDR